MDIGANLTDRMYQGVYHGGKKHAPDLERVIQRSFENGVRGIIITVGCIRDLGEAARISSTHGNVYFTLGQHPTCAKQPLEPVLEAYHRLAGNAKLAFLGEMGLDYDRLHFAPREQQLDHFKRQLEAFSGSTRPLFLHCRNAHSDFFPLIKNIPNRKIVHSFTGSLDEMHEFLNLGCYIGFNGCSFKEESQLRNATECPLERMLLESDCPWCEIRPTHAGFRYIRGVRGESLGFQSRYRIVRPEKFEDGCVVKGRNEPSGTLDVALVISALKNVPVERVLDVTTETALGLLRDV